MKIYRYWASATETVVQGRQRWQFKCYGGSDRSVEDALREASQRARAAATRIQRGEQIGRYEYGERHLREEIVDEFGDQGRTVAVVTRNSYGSLILNTPDVMFVDIDYRPRSPMAGLKGLIASLFGHQRPSEDEEIVARVREICERRTGLGLRLYRTTAGFRCLVTSGTFDPVSDESAELLAAFRSDPLYRRLCSNQACYRARLSPKHWRCDVPPPPSRFPFETEAEEAAYRRWEKDYTTRTGAHSVCAYIGDFGAPEVDARVAPVLAIHDRTACSGDGPLA